jgi:hypothetical protein
MDASASPRKPSDSTLSRSVSVAIFDVAWRASASGSSSGGMPRPLSQIGDALDAALVEPDGDLGGAGVERVFQQFLDDRGRPFDRPRRRRSGK